jgi:hypothetical protein
LRARPNGGLDACSRAEANKRGCHKRAVPQRQRLRGVQATKAWKLHTRQHGSERI